MSIALAVAIGVPLGVALTRRPRAGARRCSGSPRVVQTIPSLALFGFLIPVPLIGGIGTRTALVALVVYALLPILRNTDAGITSVDPAIREAAVGLGMTPGERLRLGRAAARAAGRSRGRPHRDRRRDRARDDRGGDRRRRARRPHLPRRRDRRQPDDPRRRAAGGRCSRSAADAALGALERRWSAGGPREARRGRARRRCCSSAAAAAATAPSVGSKNFTEQVLLGEIAAQALEAAGPAVDRRLESRRHLRLPQGAARGRARPLSRVHGHGVHGDPEARSPSPIRPRVRSAVASALREAVGPRLVAAARLREHLRARRARRGRARAGASARSPTSRPREGDPSGLRLRVHGARRTASPGLARAYGLAFPRRPVEMDLGLLYPALGSRKVDLVAGNSTDGLIAALGAVVLEDDRRYFPPYEAAFVVRGRVWRERKGVRQALEALGGRDRRRPRCAG